MVDIELHIEALVLHGFDPTAKHRIGTAVQDELARLLAGQGAKILFEHGSHLERIDGGSFTIREGERPDSIGVRVGQAVYEGMAGNLEHHEQESNV